MTTNAEQSAARAGPAFLELGLRPFFLGAAVWAAFAMILWIVILSGGAELPTNLDPVSWHAHELLFGYLGAVLGGFMMTAVPNWTGRPPIKGRPLAGLFVLWIAGRMAVAVSGELPPVIVAAVDLSFLVVLLLAMTREIIAAGNWRNLVIIGLLLFFIMANGLFHYNAALGEYAANGVGFRLGLAVAIMMIGVVGGRIIPAFTRNWLVKQGATVLPVQPMQRFDKLALLVLLGTLMAWIVWPDQRVVGVALLAAAAMHLVRLSRWAGLRTLHEPLMWILHAGYAFIPLGALAMGVSVIWPDLLDQASAQHLWMAGAIGVMTLAVMTRATLGHTGRDLSARGLPQLIFLSLILSVVVRVVAGCLPDLSAGLFAVSGMLWVAGFAGFAVLYGPVLIAPRRMVD